MQRALGCSIPNVTGAPKPDEENRGLAWYGGPPPKKKKKKNFIMLCSFSVVRFFTPPRVAIRLSSYYGPVVARKLVKRMECESCSMHVDVFLPV